MLAHWALLDARLPILAQTWCQEQVGNQVATQRMQMVGAKTEHASLCEIFTEAETNLSPGQAVPMKWNTVGKPQVTLQH